MIERLNVWIYSPDVVSAPGETLQELLDERDISRMDLAARMGRPIKTINAIIKGKAKIVPATAVELERALELPATFWNERGVHSGRDCKLHISYTYGGVL